jgi:hypothetical protein
LDNCEDRLKKLPEPADNNNVQLLVLWALAAAMALLVATWGFRNRRFGYRRLPRRPLLEEGFRLLRRFEQPQPLQTVPAPPARKTPVEQLVSLSLAVQSAAPAPAEVPVPEKLEDPEVIHSPT